MESQCPANFDCAAVITSHSAETQQPSGSKLPSKHAAPLLPKLQHWQWSCTKLPKFPKTNQVIKETTRRIPLNQILTRLLHRRCSRRAQRRSQFKAAVYDNPIYVDRVSTSSLLLRAQRGNPAFQSSRLRWNLSVGPGKARKPPQPVRLRLPESPHSSSRPNKRRTPPWPGGRS